MRPRINTFGEIKFRELHEYLNKYSVYGFTIKIKEDVFIYSFMMMHRYTKKSPETLYVKVSKVSKNVLEVWTSKTKFKNIYELKSFIQK